MQHVTRRFRTRARIITVAALVAAAVVLLGGALALALAEAPHGGIVVAYALASAAVVALLGVFALLTARHARALRRLAERHPGDVVVLARRLPPVVDDVPAFLRSKGLQVEIGDGWYAALVDGRGISVHAPGREPRELLLMEWTELGAISMVRTPTVGGDSRWSVTVDVRPYAVPLTVDVGGAWGVVTMPLDAADTAALLRAIEARRP